MITTYEAARRLARPRSSGERTEPGDGLGIGDKVRGLRWSEHETFGGVAITATPARHGPIGTPRIHEVCGFLIDSKDAPLTWISGDTVYFDALGAFIAEKRERRIDVVVIHCGGVRFPKLPLLGSSLFTFDSAQVVRTCRELDPRVIVPIHRSGWAHFREAESELRSALDGAGFGERVRWLDLGERISLG